MYPKINVAGVSNQVPSQTTAPSNTFSTSQSPGSPKEPSATSLRVVIAEKFRVAPPVMAPHGAVAALASDTSSANQPPPATCDYERSILRELEGQTKPMSAVEGLRKNDYYDALTSQCVASGYSREESSMALSVVLATAGSRADVAVVLGAAHKVRQLRDMGCSFSAAVGALVARNGDLQAAGDLASL